jgi:large subunit ribosomal protein L25
MAQSATIKVQERAKLGTLNAEALRGAGRIPANLQSKDGAHLDFHFDEREFLATRRRHVHLYDLDFGGKTESAVVRELQWDTFGERILHVEFKRVQRGVQTETQVELAFIGAPLGVVNQIQHHVTIRSIPSLIPDNIEVRVAGMEIGTTIRAKDLVLPEGVSLAIDPETDLATIISAHGVEAAKPGDEAPGEGAPV